jgi:RNA polymerase sigma-70 factor (ECF subfamily)
VSTVTKQRKQVETLYRDFGPLVYRRTLKMLRNPQDAEEATQDIFIRVINGIEKFDGRSQLSTWLFQVTTNYCLNKIRDTRRRQDIWQENVVPVEKAKATTAPSQDQLLTQELLAEAHPDQAKAAVYVYIEGMTGEEAAHMMGVSRRTVTNLLERFRAWAVEKLAKPPP